MLLYQQIAIVLTACGIETVSITALDAIEIRLLQ